MPQFTHAFEVKAKQQEVAAFHNSTQALKRLTPPPMFVQLREIEPLGEGSRSRFVMWFGPIPARWRAVHTNVGPRGFTDSQEVGPLRRWRHRHTFTALDEERTLVVDQVIYDHHGGWRGLLTRLVFNRPGLALLFTYRKWATRWYLRASQERARLARRALVLGLLPLAIVLLFLWKGGER